MLSVSEIVAKTTFALLKHRFYNRRLVNQGFAVIAFNGVVRL